MLEETEEAVDAEEKEFRSEPMEEAPAESSDKLINESEAGGYISKVSEIWSDVLGEKVTDVNKSFFELGGDSLGIVKMINLISEEYAAELSIIDIINNNSVKKVAGLLENVVQEGII